MPLTLLEASEQTGITKQGLLKAIKTGKISANKDPHGKWIIEPAELFRVYKQQQVTGNEDKQVGDSLHIETTLKINNLESELKQKNEKIQDLKEQLDKQEKNTQEWQKTISQALLTNQQPTTTNNNQTISYLILIIVLIGVLAFFMFRL